MNIIYDANILKEPVPQGFNAVKIYLDGTHKSSLDWKVEEQTALSYTERGLKIFWELDIGLFPKMKKPLSNKPQFETLKLAVQHFMEAMWEKFSTSTAALALCRGTVDFSSALPWSDTEDVHFLDWQKRVQGHADDRFLKQLFCRDSLAEYFDLLTADLPDELDLSLILDARDISDQAQLIHLLSKDPFRRYQLAVQSPIFAVQDAGWECDPGRWGFIGRHLPKTLDAVPSSVGCCLPSSYDLAHYAPLRNVLDTLEGINCRMVPEDTLTSQWDGLDVLIVFSDHVTENGKRKLQGFRAAGGTVVAVGDIPKYTQGEGEVLFSTWWAAHTALRNSKKSP